MNIFEASMSVVRKGLAQIPMEGLQKIVRHIKQGKPVLMDGTVVKNLEYG